jgi:putative tricarboxylic transport membrane protein
VISGVPRYSFDIPELTDGIGFVAIAMGVFGFGEIIANLGQPAEHREVFTKDVKGLWPTREDFRQAWPAVLRGTALGSCSACCRAAARCCRVCAYTVEKKLAGPDGRFGRATSAAWPAPRRPTTPARRPASSRC